jgi:NADH:ubiquinone oxidoreductase subunit 3 (subunit A)
VVGSLFGILIVSAIFFSCIFWILTFLAKFFYSNKYYSNKFNFYECGFKSINKFQISYSINFLLLVLFLLLYDGEFLIIIPFSLNILSASPTDVLLLIYFLIWLQLTLILDYVFNALEWQI